MKILVGAPVANRAWILQDWFDAIYAQEIDAEVKVLVYYTPSTDGTLDILAKNGALIVQGIERRTRTRKHMEEHVWSRESGEYAYMAYMRNQIRKAVRDSDADYFFSLDTDVLIPPNLIKELLHSLEIKKANAVSPLMNMQKDPLAPIAWNFMNWQGSLANREMGTAFGSLPQMPFKADVIMAAILMDRVAMQCEWQDDAQGEDIGWARNADKLGLKRYIEPLIVVQHKMRSSEYV